MDLSPDTMRDGLVAAMPNLRAFAIALCGNPHTANDLVQETLVKAWTHRAKFVPGSNLKAWLFTILRNTYFSELRRRRREVQDVDGLHASRVASAPEQNGHADFRDFSKALEKLPTDQREALILIGAEGFAYEEAAEIAGCAVGTIKSRVNRARARLVEMMAISAEEDLGPDGLTRAVVGSSPRHYG